MRFAQFYKPSTGYVPGSIPPRFDSAYVAPIEACGDRGVIIIDARIKPETACRIAAEECARRGFIGWRIFEGRSFSDSRPVSGYWPAVGREDKKRSKRKHGGLEVRAFLDRIGQTIFQRP